MLWHPGMLRDPFKGAAPSLPPAVATLFPGGALWGQIRKQMTQDGVPSAQCNKKSDRMQCNPCLDKAPLQTPLLIHPAGKWAPNLPPDGTACSEPKCQLGCLSNKDQVALVPGSRGACLGSLQSSRNWRRHQHFLHFFTSLALWLSHAISQEPSRNPEVKSVSLFFF